MTTPTGTPPKRHFFGMRFARRCTAFSFILGVAGCSAYFPVNQALTQWRVDAGYRLTPPAQGMGAQRSSDLLLVLAFSGGGTRAAALSYGVLQELAATRIRIGNQERRLIDEVDLVSGVSGGSFTAAYFGLYADRIFEDFEGKFLKRNMQSAMLWRLLWPMNWVRLFSATFERGELATEFYDETVFDRAQFSNLDRPDRPRVLINATDIRNGTRFTFTQDQFDLLCSDLSSFSVARAVAASSAVPVLLSPVTLRNYAGSCGYEPPPWLGLALAPQEKSRRRKAFARAMNSYLSSERRRFIHVVDGGIADNLGVRAVFDTAIALGDARPAMQALGGALPRQVVVVVVNAETRPSRRWDLLDYALPAFTILDSATTVQISRYNFETLELLRSNFDVWTKELQGQGHEIEFHLVEVGFHALPAYEDREYFGELPTSFSLPGEAVDRLKDAGRLLLRSSPEFSLALRRIGDPAQP